MRQADPLVFVCWKWRPRLNYRSKFTGQHVNTLARMINRHYRAPHKVICFTDDPRDIDHTLVDARPLWNDHANVPNPCAPALGPSCYRRLKMFSRDAASWIGERICSIDLDVVITGELHTLLNRPEDFVIWGDTSPPTPYNGSLILFTAGARPQLWEEFDPVKSPQMGRAMRYQGSDQAWISVKLGLKEARFTQQDGVYSFRNHIHRAGLTSLPAGARLCIFHGQHDPDGPIAQRLEWVRSCYR